MISGDSEQTKGRTQTESSKRALASPSVTLSVKKKRARMGVDKTPKSETPNKPKRANTRVRTLRDVLNTIGDKENDVTTKKEAVTPKSSKKSDDKSVSDSSENSTSYVVATKAAVSSSDTFRRVCFKSRLGRPSKDGNYPGPSRRWGHTLSMITDKEAVMIGGQGDKQQLCKDSIWHLDICNGKWKQPGMSSVTPNSSKPESRMGHTAVYDPTVRSIYIFGGSKNKKWFNDVHVLDVDEWKWQLIKADGKAPTRAYHSCTLYRHELWILGGVYPRPDPQPDGCSNEMHVFSPIENSWYKPIVMGEEPVPRSGHSATLLRDRLVVFGGWDAPIVYNDLYVLDLILLEWSQPKTNGTPPSPRSWHASCALAGERVLIHGGYNGNDALEDSFIFNLDTLAWTQVKLDPPITQRAGHTALCLPYRFENNKKDQVLIFGGGDNEGSFFQDMACVMVPFENTTEEPSGQENKDTEDDKSCFLESL